MPSVTLNMWQNILTHINTGYWDNIRSFGNDFFRALIKSVSDAFLNWKGRRDVVKSGNPHCIKLKVIVCEEVELRHR